MGRRIHETEQRFPDAETNDHDQATPSGKIKTLEQRKRTIELGLQAQYETLKINGTDLNTPLTDRNGFPRDDIPDLASVRVARTRIHELKNDLREVVDLLAQTLPLILSKNDNMLPQSTNNALGNGSFQSSMEPFAKVDLVLPGSPAELAGLKVDDQLVRFGHLNAKNHERLTALSTLATEHDGEELNVVWFRSNSGKRQMYSHELVPRSGWGGRGLLGFHIIPL
ncbi:hypothetical protein O181_050226 [Austropuccinia psidii MF-1]|uniref:Probable 26S proteasome regulatory subunit p27 n=1 Tax=Austropuccinia psidii MF-1 TaxID=1389203 RepID=A0A9Q3DTX8_9BASI|nr:hypothetical protein [Austropuccinia psidii MF-1]